MNDTLKKMYEHHHGTARASGFSIMKSDRGELFANIIGTGKRVLDLGCRDGALTSYFSKDNTVIGVDIDTISLKRAHDSLGIETMSFDIQSDWPQFPGGNFDAVVAGEFLEHVFYPDKVMEKVSHILLPGGVFTGSVPNAFSLKNRIKYLFAIKKYTPLSDPTHINQFSAVELRVMLLRYFKDAQIVGMGRLGILARMCPRLFAFDLAFVAHK